MCIKYKKLTIVNDFMFAKVMTNIEICKEVLEVLLGIQIQRIEYITDQKFMKRKKHSKGVVLDVLVFDGETYYNIEMQNRGGSSIASRRAYYRAILTTHFFEQGKDYSEIPKVHIIFVCTFSALGRRRYKHVLKTRSDGEWGLNIYDKVEDYFFSTKLHAKADTDELRKLLAYLNGGKPTNKLTRRIEAEVQKVIKDQALEGEFMKYEWDLRVRGIEGFKRGEKQGIIKGMEKGVKQGIIKGEKQGIIKGEKQGIIKGVKQGEKQGALRTKLELASEMLEVSEVDEIAKLFKLDVVFVRALMDGRSIEDILKQCKFS